MPRKLHTVVMSPCVQVILLPPLPLMTPRLPYVSYAIWIQFMFLLRTLLLVPSKAVVRGLKTIRLTTMRGGSLTVVAVTVVVGGLILIGGYGVRMPTGLTLWLLVATGVQVRGHTLLCETRPISRIPVVGLRVLALGLQSVQRVMTGDMLPEGILTHPVAPTKNSG